MTKKPSMVEYGKIPSDLARVLEQLRHNEIPPDFRGIPGTKLVEWIPRVGQKGKLPTQLKAFRLRKEDVDLLQEIAARRGLTETDVVRAGLRALVEHGTAGSASSVSRYHCRCAAALFHQPEDQANRRSSSKGIRSASAER